VYAGAGSTSRTGDYRHALSVLSTTSASARPFSMHISRCVTLCSHVDKPMESLQHRTVQSAGFRLVPSTLFFLVVRSKGDSVVPLFTVSIYM
jgi:hypothetical protein